MEKRIQVRRQLGEAIEVEWEAVVEVEEEPRSWSTGRSGT
jgi:hypothetical protein